MNKRGAIWVFSIIAIVAMVAVYATLITPEDETPDEPPDADEQIIAEPPDMSIVPVNPIPVDTPEDEEETEPTLNDPEPDPEARPFVFIPYAIPETLPELMLALSEVRVDGVTMDSYTLPERIDFGFGFNYSQVDGVTTFRGNNQRDSAAFGRADIQTGRLSKSWSARSGSYTTPDGALWTGHGWTGQPLIVRWHRDTRQAMNMNAWAQDQDDLVEVIYPAMDGKIYFFELETGKVTRSAYNIGFPFKGCGAVDPRGYPLLYIGAGDHAATGRAQIFIISLIDGSVLYTFGRGDPFSLRDWPMADASPLVDAGTDMLIYPGENGILYILKLNSRFDPVAGTMTIDPDNPYRWRYRGKRTGSGGFGRFWLGFESSPAVWRGHIFLADNGGHLICLDLNTLKVVWVVDNIDNTDTTPVISVEDGHPYIYISMSFNGNGVQVPTGTSTRVPIRKIDALTGRIVWETDHFCFVESIAGGVQATIASGQHELRDLIFVSIARTPSFGSGLLVALDKSTGDTVWEFQTSSYGWGSPVAVYNEEGQGYILHTTLTDKKLFLIEGLTGKVLDRFDLGGHVEASPAVFESTVVIGTRWQDIWGIRLT